MAFYHPMATYKQDTPSVLGNTLFTYDNCNTMAEAREIIRRWANECGYHLTSAWIDRWEGNKKKRYKLF